MKIGFKANYSGTDTDNYISYVCCTMKDAELPFFEATDMTIPFNTEYEIDLVNYASNFSTVAQKSFTLLVQDKYGEERSMQFKVQLVELSVRPTQPDMFYADSSTYTYDCDVNGGTTLSGRKVTYTFYSENNLLSPVKTIDYETTINGNVLNPLNLSGLTHGAYVMKVQASGSIGGGSRVESNILTHKMIYFNSEAGTPVFTVLLPEVTEQYSNIPLQALLVTGGTNKNYTLDIKLNGVSTTQLTITAHTPLEYNLMFEDIGKYTLTVTVVELAKTVTQILDIVKYTGNLPVIDTGRADLDLYLSPRGKTNDVLDKNMKNYLKYVYYLINPSKYANPVLDVNNAPLMSPECGFYHPDLGIYTIVPDGNTINGWIKNNPGYDADGHGSLNWMIEDYPSWLENTLDPTTLFKTFEKDYIGNISYDKPFIAIATYYSGGSVVDALIRGYEANGRAAFNVFKTGTVPSMSSILNKITDISTVGISAITSLYSWSLNYANGSAEGDLEDIDLAVLKGVYDISETSYLNELGPQIEWTFSVTYPSFEGVYGPIVLSYVDGMGKSHVIQSGVDKMVKLSCQWAELKEMDNADKVVSIILYNYPPGKAEIGASYLDVFQSTYDLLFQLEKAGFNVGNISDIPSLYNLTELIVKFGNKGTWARGLLNEYVEQNFDELMAHNQLIDLNQFYNLTAHIPPDHCRIPLHICQTSPKVPFYHHLEWLG